MYKVKFNNRQQADFSAELKQKVNAYFTDNNISPYANASMVFKTIFMLALAFVPYFLILFLPMAEWQMLILCVIIGLGVAGIGFAIQHDANHGAYSSNEKINRLLGFTLTLVGGNDYMWRIKHNVLHHTFTNIHGKDEDISVVKFLRLAPSAPHKPIHRIQHYIAWLAYSTLTFFWVFYFDYPKLKRYNGNGSPNVETKHPRTQVFLLFAMKAFYYFYAIALPLILLNVVWWKVLIGFTVSHLVSGFLLTTIFQLAHVVEDMEFPVTSKDDRIETSWMIHQMETTANFSRGNAFISWFVGGLNYQVEHHLFPKICSVHYPAISHIVKDVAEKYGVSYHYKNSLGEALLSHFRMLKRLSKPELKLEPVLIA